jgi:transmembrane sensor
VTDIGELRIMTLEDGSVIHLDSHSRFRVHMTRDQRRIELFQGQALFEVAHDPARPFIVNSGNVSVRAVGTQFDVNQTPIATIVTVVEGRVRVGSALPQTPAVDRPLGSASAPLSVSPDPGTLFAAAGDQVRVAPNGRMLRSEKANTSAAISWLHQELRFDGESLSEVLDAFNRYTKVPIVLADPSLGDVRINAVFHTTSPESLLRYVATLDGVEVQRTEKEIRILRK